MVARGGVRLSLLLLVVIIVVVLTAFGANEEASSYEELHLLTPPCESQQEIDESLAEDGRARGGEVVTLTACCQGLF